MMSNLILLALAVLWIAYRLDKIDDIVYSLSHASRNKILPKLNLMKEKKRHNLQWFIDRISKRVYRQGNPLDCPCEFCKEAHEKGFIIADKFHAQYLYDMQEELALIYFDKKPKK